MSSPSSASSRPRPDACWALLPEAASDGFWFRVLGGAAGGLVAADLSALQPPPAPPAPLRLASSGRVARPVSADRARRAG